MTRITKHFVIKSILLQILQIYMSHYSKSQMFVQKFNFDKTLTFSRVFHPIFFLTIFLVKSKLSTAKKSKTTTFSRVFHPPKKSIILLNFWTKNEDFEQYVEGRGLLYVKFQFSLLFQTCRMMGPRSAEANPGTILAIPSTSLVFRGIVYRPPNCLGI